MAKNTKAAQTVQATQFIAGIQKHLVNAPPVTLASKAYTAAQLTTAFGLLVSLRQAVAAAKTAEQKAVAADNDQTPTIVSLMAAFVSYLMVTYDGSPDVLADFGLSPRKKASAPTAEKKAVAVLMRASTRKARGTTSKKQKQEIHGDVVSAVMTPVTASEPVVTPSPAPNAPSNGSPTGGGTSHGT